MIWGDLGSPSLVRIADGAHFVVATPELVGLEFAADAGAVVGERVDTIAPTAWHSAMHLQKCRRGNHGCLLHG